MTPSGSPAWTRNAVHTDYGGDVNKRNFLSQGVIDDQTDVGAEAITRLAADMEALVRSAPFAVITYACNDASPAAPTILAVYMMTGVRTSSYAGNAAPTGFPSAARNGNGDVTFTFASSYNDDYGIAGAFSIRHAAGTVQDSSPGTVSWQAPTSTTLRLRLFDNAGSALSDKTATVAVW